MKTFLGSVAIVLLVTISYGAGLEAPIQLTASWNSTTTGRIILTWTDRAASNTGYIIQRKIVTNITSTSAVLNANWTNLVYLAGDAQGPYTDVLPASTTENAYYYRVRPVTGTGTSTVYGEAAEVVIIGKPSESTTASSIDSDADGLKDNIEAAKGLSPTDWADGTADKDNDGIPNSWEPNELDKPNDADNTVKPAVIVDASLAADNLTSTPPQVRTISSALTTARLGTVNNPVPPIKLIHVRPGFYNENVTIPGGYKIALVRSADSSDHREVEIRGVATTPAVPVIATSGSFVLDGFVLTRAPGSRGIVVDVGDLAEPNSRPTLCRLVNCLIPGADTGVNAVVENYRCRLIISHCTLWMNSADTSAIAHSYSTGPLSSSGAAVSPGTGYSNTVMEHYLQTTSRLVIHNSILWNPLTTTVPEIYQAIPPQVMYGTSIIYGVPGMGADPKLTPDGYMMGPISINVLNQATIDPDLRVLRDLHGVPRGATAGRVAAHLTWLESSVEVTGHDIGAQQWWDSDEDGIPDFADRNSASTVNAIMDLDFDGLTELQEYLSGTSLTQSDSTYLTLAQAQNLFAPFGSSNLFTSYYTKVESDTLFVKKSNLPIYYTKSEVDAAFVKKNTVIRVEPGSDLSMGEFTNGQLP